MEDIITNIRSKAGLVTLSGASKEQIAHAEKELGVTFSDEYREYIASYGIASFEGHELTGICAFPRLDVVNVTKEERQFTPTVPLDYYVIEQAHVDGIVIWQSNTGEVIQTSPNSPIISLCSSLSEYIKL